MPRRKRFNSEKVAQSFAKKVNGKVNDLREIEGAKSLFTVTYEPSEKTRLHGQMINMDFCPEDNGDFGYPNEYWK